MSSATGPESRWFVFRNGKTEGPFSSREIKRLAESGKLAPTDLVSQDGSNTWAPAGHVSDLFTSQCSQPVPPTVCPAEGNWQTFPAASPGGQALPALPGYEILRRLGEGGMGVVYRARDVRLGRLVALKMIRGQQGVSAAARERFFREARAVARIQHPGIVQIFEVGEAEGQPFIALELVPGGSLIERIRHTPPAPPEAARLIESLARAMDVVHRAGIVHRDLKPHNVLVGEDGALKVTDFGLAKDLSSDDQTRTGEVVGTVAYMAPEQARGDVKAIGPHTDVYALGVMLYEMLCGCRPFDGPPMAVLYGVMHRDPDPPSRLRPGLPRDLEMICLKCLEKDPKRRYRTALELAEELGRFQRGEPVQVRPLGMAGRTWRWARRNPAVAALLTTVMLTLTTGVIVASVFAVQANQKAKDAREALDRETTARKEAQHQLYVGQIRLAWRQWQAGQFDLAREALALAPKTQRNWEYYYLDWLLNRSHQTFVGHKSRVHCVAFSPDGKRIVSSSEDETVKVWDARTGRELLTLRGHTEQIVGSVAFSPDGKHIVSGGRDKTVKVWDAQTGKEAFTLKGHTESVHGVAFSPDGKHIASVSGDATLKVWDARTGKEVRTVPGHAGVFISVAFSPDGKRIASGGEDKTVKVWDVHTGEEVHILKGHTDTVASAKFSPDGKRIVSASDKIVKLWWDAQMGQDALTLEEHTAIVTDVAFSPDGNRIASASEDATLKVWDAATGDVVFTLKGHTGGVRSVAFSPDGKRIASGGDHTVKVWDARSGQEVFPLRRGGQDVTSVVFTPDGKRIVAAGSKDKTVEVWDAETGLEALNLEGHTEEVRSVAISPDGKHIVSGSRDMTVKVWNVQTGKVDLTLNGHTRAVDSVAFSSDGKRIASGSDDGTVKVWEAQTGKVDLTLRGHTEGVLSVAFSPDGKRIASGSDDKTVKVWELQSGLEVLTFKGHTGSGKIVAFSADGKHIVSGSGDETVKVWDAQTGQEVLTLKGHTSMIESVAFSPDGKRIVSGDWDGFVKVWDAQTGQELLTLREEGVVSSVAFSPDGRRIASATLNGTIKIWDSHQP